MPWEWDKVMHASWREKVQFELIEIRAKIDALEAGRIGVPTREVGTAVRTPAKGEIGEVSELYAQEETMAPLTNIEGYGTGAYTPDNLIRVLVLTAQARRAIYGYGMLLNEFGLDKNQARMVRQLEEATGAVLRLTQGISLVRMAAAALEIESPWAIPLLIMAGGTFAASIGYSMKMAGGGY